MTEAQFQESVVQLAAWHGWAMWHDFDSRRNMAGGWPDLFLSRPPRIIVAELKVGKNTTTAEQREWLQRFADCGIEAAVFRPDRAAEGRAVAGGLHDGSGRAGWPALRGGANRVPAVSAGGPASAREGCGAGGARYRRGVTAGVGAARSSRRPYSGGLPWWGLHVRS